MFDRRRKKSWIENDWMWKKCVEVFSISSSHSISTRQLCRFQRELKLCAEKRRKKIIWNVKNDDEKHWNGVNKKAVKKKLPCFNANTCVSCDCVGSHIASSGVGIWQFLCKYFLPLFSSSLPLAPQLTHICLEAKKHSKFRARSRLNHFTVRFQQHRIQFFPCVLLLAFR